MIDLTDKYKLNDHRFVMRRVGDETVLVPLSDNVADMTSVLTFNEVGSDILAALEQPATGMEVVEKLLTLYHVEKEMLEKDVEDFIAEAIEKKVIEKIG